MLQHFIWESGDMYMLKTTQKSISTSFPVRTAPESWLKYTIRLLDKFNHYLYWISSPLNLLISAITIWGGTRPVSISKILKFWREIQKMTCRPRLGHALGPTFMKSTLGVNFIKVGCTAQIIEIALSICALCLCTTFGGAFYWRKSWAQGHRAQKQFMKSTPGLQLLTGKRLRHVPFTDQNHLFGI